MHTLAKKYTSLSSWFSAKYAETVKYLGVQDTDETRVFLAVAASVALYMVLSILARLWSLACDASALMMAIVHA